MTERELRRRRRAGRSGPRGSGGRKPSGRYSIYPDGQVYLPAAVTRALGYPAAVALRLVFDGGRMLDGLVARPVDPADPEAFHLVDRPGRGGRTIRLRQVEQRVVAGGEWLTRGSYRALTADDGEAGVLLDAPGLAQRASAWEEDGLAEVEHWRLGPLDAPGWGHV